MFKLNRPCVAAVRLVGVGMIAGLVPVVLAHTATTAGAAALNTAPKTPPAQICGNATVLDGPATQPAGSVRIDPGQDLGAATNAQPAGTTFWLAPGTYTLGASQFGQVIPKDNNTYVGAPGAVIDGHNVNRFAFTQQAAGVTIKNLTIQNFGTAGDNNNEGVVNHDGGSGWQVKYNTIQYNAGAGLFIGSNNVVSYNCLRNNGQYGFSMYKAVLGSLNTITLDHNEVAGNNTYDWESRIAGCGCSGGGKFWDAHNVTVTNNWVHDNKSVGLWADTNNYGFVIDGNYIAGNDSEGIFYELSYNARITNNTLTRNAIVKGKDFASRNDPFPIVAVYISESGGDSRVNGGLYSTLDISGNSLVDNWGGVALWENSDRFCGNGFSTAYCTLVNPGVANLGTCNSTNINSAPYYADCRWKTQNVSVHDNQLTFSRANAGCTTAACGQQALLANYGSYPTWSPYQGRAVQDAITYRQNNHFSNNSYVGDWVFTPYETTGTTFAGWQGAPYSQDNGSTSVLVAAPVPTTPVPATTVPTTTVPATTTTVPATTTTTKPPAPTTTTTTVTPPVLTNILDGVTSTLTGGLGLWAPWYSANLVPSTAQAHSAPSSLRVDVTAPWGWGVQLNTWPGLLALPGNKTISFWGLAGTGSNMSVTMQVTWMSLWGAPLRTDLVTIAALGSTWKRASQAVVTPPGTAFASVHVVGSTPTAGQSLYLDDFTIVNS
jgi:hypothetical protein